MRGKRMAMSGGNLAVQYLKSFAYFLFKGCASNYMLLLYFYYQLPQMNSMKIDAGYYMQKNG